MSRHMFGWSYPPGAANDPYAPWNQEDGPCAVCGKLTDECICPECPACSAVGDPKCYTAGHKGATLKGEAVTLPRMKLTREQVISRQEVRVQNLKIRVEEEQMLLKDLRNGREFSDDLADNPDPWR